MEPKRIIAHRQHFLKQVDDNDFRPNIKELLKSIDSDKIIPILSNPHSIFFLTSLQNFAAACEDWLIMSLKEAGKVWVSQQHIIF
jgi:hypothetical protein